MIQESELIAKLRQQAKKLKKLTGEQHTKCLHEVAKANGYKSWEKMLEKLNK